VQASFLLVGELTNFHALLTCKKQRYEATVAILKVESDGSTTVYASKVRPLLREYETLYI